MTRLSIITVCRNSEKTLRRTIDSVLAQAEQICEYIIIDGTSTDGTLEILRKYAPRFCGKMRIVSEPDGGVYDAMNKGLQMASGDYIGILNSDDLYKPDCFQSLLQTIAGAELPPDVVYSDLDVIDKEGRILRRIYGDARLLKRGMLVNHPSCFVRREAYASYGMFDTQYKIAADYELMLRIFHGDGRFAKCPHILAEYRTGGLSENNYRSVQEKYRIQRRYYGLLHCLYIRARGYYRCKIRPRLAGKGWEHG